MTENADIFPPDRADNSAGPSADGPHISVCDVPNGIRTRVAAAEGTRLTGLVLTVGGRCDRQNTGNRVDAVDVSMLVDEVRHHLTRSPPHREA